MSYPLVRELADDGVPVTVTCRVLGLARAPYYRWLANPVSDAEWEQAHLANALFDAHRDDPEFGYRFLADEAKAAGFVAAERTVWRICSANGWFSVFGKKKRGKKAKVGVPAHDDLVRRDFTAAAPNTVWLSDITEHPTPCIPAVVATPTGGGGVAGPIYSKEQKERFFELVDKGGTVRAAAKVAGVSEDAAYRWLRQAGLSMQRATPRKFSEQSSRRPRSPTSASRRSPWASGRALRSRPPELSTGRKRAYNDTAATTVRL